MMAVKAVTFDLWLTLIWDSKELEEYRRLRRLVNFYRFVQRVRKERDGMLHETNGFRYSDVRLAMESLSLKVKKLYEKGYDIHPRDRGRMLFELMGMKFPEDLSPRIYERSGRILSQSGYRSHHPNLNPEALPALRLLKKKIPNVKVALVSNAARSAKAYERLLGVLGVAGYFDHFIISCEVGYLKPRKEIFQKALDLLRVEPRETLHVGDLFRADVVGAVSSGMNACLYTGLWHKYAQYMNPREHIPRDFDRNGVVVREIEKLSDCVRIASAI